LLVDLIVEANNPLSERDQRAEKRGSYHTLKDGVVSSKKSKVVNYPSIKVALRRGYPGQIFSTKGAARLYVTSKAGWGKKSSGRIAKGFTPGAATPSAKWDSIKGHSVRTMKKHGKQKSKKFDTYKAGAKNSPGKQDEL
tara:strand:+ start:4515 stop:4931 length:417 start_codon:yes stop_codon:yes gene_type:complete